MIRNVTSLLGPWTVVLSINEQVNPTVKTISVICHDEGLRNQKAGGLYSFKDFSYSWTTMSNSTVNAIFAAATAQSLHWAQVSRMTKNVTVMTQTPMEILIAELVAMSWYL